MTKITIKQEFNLILNNTIYRRAYLENFILIPFFCVIFAQFTFIFLFKVKSIGQYSTFYYVLIWIFFLILMYIIDYKKIKLNNDTMKAIEAII